MSPVSAKALQRIGIEGCSQIAGGLAVALREKARRGDGDAKGGRSRGRAAHGTPLRRRPCTRQGERSAKTPAWVAAASANILCLPRQRAAAMLAANPASSSGV